MTAEVIPISPVRVTCCGCGEDAGPRPQYRTRDGAREFYCMPCADALRARAETARAEREAREIAERPILARRWLMADAPDFEWARVGTEAFCRAVPSPKLRGFSENWRPEHGPALLLGPSGCGKTTSVVAVCWRLLDEISETRSGYGSFGDPRWHLVSDSPIAKLHWSTGATIAYARRNSPLGEESPTLTKAIDSGVLIIDEVGFESTAPAPEIMMVVDARYAKRRPTIVTSGLTRTEFVTRYGAALFRRLTQFGTVVDCHPQPSEGRKNG